MPGRLLTLALLAGALGCRGRAGPPEPFDDGAPFGLDARPDNPTCFAPDRPQLDSTAGFQRAFPNLAFAQPVALLQPPSDAGEIWIVQRQGAIVAFPNLASAQPGDVRTVVDLTARIDTSGEGGLLGVAFHPEWPTRREVFVSYTEGGGGGPALRSVIARLRSFDNGLTLDPGPEERLLVLDQPYDNHNGGNIAFGPDGFLYIGFGDGGSGGDPLGAGQRTDTVLGKMLRIDVNVPAIERYAIPSGNPFAASGAVCQRDSTASTHPSIPRCAEIYALGFRNPWRWSFDRESGELWVGDVGQGTWEEVDRVELGGNYGWNQREGAHCYGGGVCQTAGLIDPIVEYGHDLGNSITGGFVYRGASIPGLVGSFVFADYGSGRVWAVTGSPTTGGYARTALFETGLAIAGFGQTHDGEVFLLSLFDGAVHRLVPTSAPPPTGTFPQRLSETGCFDAQDPRQPVSALVPYDVNASLWSDGADKERGFAVPDGTTIEVDDEGDWQFPPGTVLSKTFSLNGRRVETRLFMRHFDGVWAGYSYEWNAEQTDAVLLPAGKTVSIDGRSWTFPSRPQCLACHTAAAGRALGLENAQLNRSFLYPSGRRRNQLDTLSGLGFFPAALGDPAGLPRLEPPFGEGSLEARARSYLHANCAICHRAAAGAGQGPADFRYALTYAETGTCSVAPQNGTLGLNDPSLIFPGDPARSIVSARMHALGAARMPPLASSVVDDAGVGLVDAWIASQSSCPQ